MYASIETNAAIILKCCDAIEQKFKMTACSTIVLLGRDCWIFLPLLLAKGLPVQYFLFSRLQRGDEGTKKAWLKEIPCYSMVVDTGYMGSIFSSIQSFDNTITGVMLCCQNDLFTGLEIPYFEVEQIENMPKLIGRCVAINNKGIARCPQDTRDENDVLSESKDLDYVIKYNKDLLRVLGVNENWAYYTGVTREERLQPGKNSAEKQFGKLVKEFSAIRNPKQTIWNKIWTVLNTPISLPLY